MSSPDFFNQNHSPSGRYGFFAAARILLLGFLVSFLPISVGAVDAVQEGIPLELQMQIFLKIMTYNRSLQVDKLENFVVTVIFDQVHQKEFMEEEAGRLRSLLSKKTILGRPIQLNMLPLGKTLEVSTLPACHLLIIHGLPEDRKEAILNWAKDKKTLTAAAMTDAEPAEVVVLLRLDDQKPTIHFNLALARELGFDFHAQFLKHCVITK